MEDILFRTDDYVFSYRVAGILLRDNNILLQRPTSDMGFSIPGGHVEFGETNVETLIREFKEEMGVDITVGDLKWVAEIFFPWGDKPCHQICLFYEVFLQDVYQLSRESFLGKEHIERREYNIEFHWVSTDDLNKIEVYPSNMPDLMERYQSGVQHFVYRQ